MNNPAANFGWVVIGNESTTGTTFQFDSKRDPTLADRPLLTVTYTPAGDAPTPVISGAAHHRYGRHVLPAYRERRGQQQ